MRKYIAILFAFLLAAPSFAQYSQGRWGLGISLGFADGRYLKLTGGTMQGNLNLGTYRILLPTGGSASAPTIGFGTGYNTGFYEDSDGSISFAIEGSRRLYIVTNRMVATTGGGFLFETASATNPTFVPNSGDLNTGVGSAGSDSLSLIAGDIEILRLGEGPSISYANLMVATVLSQSGLKEFSDDGAITATHTICRVGGNGGVAILDADPAINDGVADGQLLILQGTNDTNLIQIANAVNTALIGDSTVTLSDNDYIWFIWDAGESLWFEQLRVDH